MPASPIKTVVAAVCQRRGLLPAVEALASRIPNSKPILQSVVVTGLNGRDPKTSQQI